MARGHQMDEMELEELRENGRIKEQLKTATQDDFDLVVGDDPYPYAASLFGCYDIALFKRKADCERFIKTFPEKQAPQTKSNGVKETATQQTSAKED